MRTNSSFSVKVIKRETNSTRQTINCKHEVKLMELVGQGCPYLIHLIGHFTTPKFKFIVIDYHGCGDLASVLHNGKPMPEGCAQDYFAE